MFTIHQYTAAEARRSPARPLHRVLDAPRLENARTVVGEAPAEVLTELEELHPGTYVIHNDAPRPETDLLD